jgi:muramoyltetrapeptide carboxypeptidase
MIRFPKPLRPGDTIAITAPSSGVPVILQPRLDLVIAHLHAQGFKTIQGKCLRTEHKDASAPASDRAAELMSFLTDPVISAAMPPWGGELACDLLDLLDFDRLRTLPPKWFSGYSDLSTLHVPLTLLSGWATAHTLNLMDLAPTQQDPLSAGVMKALSHDFTAPFTQHASKHYQVRYIDFKDQVDAAFNLTQPTLSKRLDGSSAPITLRGNLIGGCIDTIAPLAGSKYADIPAFIRNSKPHGVILYFENCDLSPVALTRTLWGLRRAGWLTGLSGLLIGRSSGPDASSPDRLSYVDALQNALGDLPFPVLHDLDIGHRPPQFTLINGAHAQVTFDSGAIAITQSLNNV